jgi:hypothetical protein
MTKVCFTKSTVRGARAGVKFYPTNQHFWCSYHLFSQGKDNNYGRYNNTSYSLSGSGNFSRCSMVVLRTKNILG